MLRLLLLLGIAFLTSLWYPYIPLGKITIVQGDPGEGKTTFALAVIAALTRGEPLPESKFSALTMDKPGWEP